MALFLLAVAAELACAGWDNQLTYLFGLLQQDIANTAFLAAFGILVILSLAGEDATLKRPAMLLGALVILAMFLKNGTGTFAQIASAVSSPTAPSSEANPPLPQGNPTINLGGGSSGGASGAAGAAIGGVKTALNAIPVVGSLIGLA